MGLKTTKEIADFVHDFKYDQIPADLIGHIKDIVSGYMSSTLAGSSLPIGRVATNYARAQSNAAEAGVFGGGFKSTLEAAAAANATMAHATELEDVAFPEGLYTLTVLAPVFAIAEHQRMTGREAIEAFVLGYEVAGKLGVACADAGAKGWMLSAVFASVGNAAAAAKLFKLDRQQTLNAISIGASQGTGIVKQTGMGAHTFEAGFAARNGICAATLAKLGLDGASNVLEGSGGMVELISGKSEFDLVDGFRTAEIGIRKYPCCGILQRNIDAMSELIADENLTIDQVESIEVEVNHTFAMYMKYSEPTTAAQTRFSIEQAIAACFLERPVFLKSFTDEAAADPQYTEIRSKVKMTVHPEWERGYFPQPTIITVRRKDGRTLTREAVFARGDAGHPVTRADISSKYQGAIDFVGILSQERADKAAQMIATLDEVRDVSELTSIFAFPDRLDTATRRVA
jgi:2-methylcitrate dehydratase PrpD